jgi:signal transduction histidine kinase
MTKPADPTMNLLDVPRPLDAAAGERLLPAQGRLPLALLTAIGERLAARALVLQEPGCDAVAEGARLERWGLQLQELAQVVARAAQLRREPVDLGLALLQTLAEWSAEADRCGIELHGPACSVLVHTNPAALKHLLDLLIEHALQQGGAVRMDIQADDTRPYATLVVHVDAAPASDSPGRETLAWQLLALLARALLLAPERHAVPGGERLELTLPRGV